jgi:hypothetical protein
MNDGPERYGHYDESLDGAAAAEGSKSPHAHAEGRVRHRTRSVMMLRRNVHRCLHLKEWLHTHAVLATKALGSVLRYFRLG